MSRNTHSFNGTTIKHGHDRNDGSIRQDRFVDRGGGGKHDHSWSKTDTVNGEHKEGYRGENSRDK